MARFTQLHTVYNEATLNLLQRAYDDFRRDAGIEPRPSDTAQHQTPPWDMRDCVPSVHKVIGWIPLVPRLRALSERKSARRKRPRRGRSSPLIRGIVETAMTEDSPLRRLIQQQRTTALGKARVQAAERESELSIATKFLDGNGRSGA